MGRLFIEDAKGEKVLMCKGCRVDSASYDDIQSKEFQGRYGRAYLFRKVSCMQLVGWRYEIAKEESQKYKEGMFILEKERMEKKGG